ncbi:hypothetical protein [Actinophytocola sediminis]
MAGDGGPSPLGQAGYAYEGSGGGGAGGRYVFASLEEFDGIITEWEALVVRIKLRGEKLARAIGMIEPPAVDLMSRWQAAAAVWSLEQAEAHRLAMEIYASEYVEKLRAARAEYATTEAENVAAIRRVGGE